MNNFQKELIRLTRVLRSISSDSLEPTRLKSQSVRLLRGLVVGGSYWRYVMLLGVLQKISMESLTQRSMSISGMSEKRRIHSLKPDSSKVSRNCIRTANPMHKGKEELPNNSLSHKWKIL